MATIAGGGLGANGEGATGVTVWPAGGAASLPQAVDLRGAAFTRTGDDLVVRDGDGDTAIVRDFFSGSERPQLLFADGAQQVSGDLAARLAGPLAPGQVAQAAGTAGAEPIGTVESIGGTVTATRADGTAVTLDAGDPVYQGDILESSTDGGIGIVLADNTTFSMGGDGRMVLDELVYDPSSQQGSLAVSVLEGVFTFVSGQIAKTDPDAMTVDTPTATIGIRGTFLGFRMLPDGSLEIVNLPHPDGSFGEITVSNSGGVQTLNFAFQGVQVLNVAIPPGQPFTANLQDVVSLLGDALGFMPAGEGVQTFGVEPKGRTAEANPDDFDTAAGGDDAGDDGGDAGFSIILAPPPAPVSPSFGFAPLAPVVVAALDDAGTGGDDGDAGEEEEEAATDPEAVEGEAAAGGGVSLIGTEGSDSLFGGTGDDTLDGLSGNDSISGGDGNDTLLGGSGDDFITGGGGDDFIDGGDGTDTANMNFLFGDFVFTNEDGVITITDQIQAANQGTDTIANVEYLQFSDGIYHVLEDHFSPGEEGGSINGSEEPDVLFGSKGDDVINGFGGSDEFFDDLGNDTVFGGEGNDRFHSHDAGSDTFHGDNGFDAVDYSATSSGVNVNLVDGTATGGDIGSDTLSSIEEVNGGSGSDLLVGNDNQNLFYGDAGGDFIIGGGGRDQMFGGSGNDVLVGGLGDDVFSFTADDLGDFDTIVDMDPSDDIILHNMSTTQVTFSYGGQAGEGEGDPASDLILINGGQQFGGLTINIDNLHLDGEFSSYQMAQEGANVIISAPAA